MVGLEIVMNLDTLEIFDVIDHDMLSQVQNIVMNDGLNLYNNQFAETLSDIKNQQSQILKLMLKNDISLSALNVKQDIVNELTTNWLHFMDDVSALEAERRSGGV